VAGTSWAILAFRAMRARLRRAGQVTTIRLAAAIPEARVLALPSAPTASPAPKPGTPS
jgi:hypothetical protein